MKVSWVNSDKIGCYEKFKGHIFLLQQSPDHNTLNFVTLGDEIQNISRQLSILNFSKHCILKYVFIFSGTNNVDHNSPIVNGLITSGMFPQTFRKC